MKTVRIVKPGTRIKFLYDLYRHNRKIISVRWEGFTVVSYDRKSDTYTVGRTRDDGTKARNTVTGIKRSFFQVKYNTLNASVTGCPGPCLPDPTGIIDRIETGLERYLRNNF